MDGDGCGGEEVAIERQLEQHLEEQRESLVVVNEALASDPSNLELLTVREELLLAIKDAEEGLLHLKRSRLFKEADAILLRQESESVIPYVEVEPLDPRQVEVEPEPLELENYSVGSKCRFRHTDGRWYNGHVVGLEGASSARISFLTPTSESMLMCKFFLQQRCRFGSNCRMSHGLSVPVSSLKQYIPTTWQQSLAGSSIWAFPGGHSGVWRKAELESWDDELELARVVFQDDGRSAELGSNALSLSEYALMSGSGEEEDDDDDLSSEISDSTEELEDPENGSEQQGLGFSEAAALESGVQSETALFAKWEHHTRGIASKMMASMGYREGMGLGASGQGITDPVSVKVLPPRQALGHTLESNQTGNVRVARVKKRSRGGRRKRAKKHAEAVRAAKAAEDRSPDVFSFINHHLVVQDAANSSSIKQKRGSGEVEGSARKENRRSLVAYDDEVKGLRSRVEKLEEMVSRNRKDKTVYEAASRKLDETLKELADAEAAHASASDAVVGKEKEKKWLKF